MSYLHVQYTNHRHVILFSDEIGSLVDHFSVQNKQAAFSASRFASSRHTMITPTGLCAIGNALVVIKHMLETYPGADIKIDPQARDLIRPPQLTQSVVVPATIEQLRPYQQHAVEQCLKAGRGIIEHPTSAGKTPLMASLILSLLPFVDKPIVVLVPDPGLASQTYNSFVKFGIDDIFLWTTENEETNTRKLSSYKVILAHQKLVTRRQDVIKKQLSDAAVLIVDECHSLQKGNKINKIINCIETPRRFGLTGTLPDSIESQWNLSGQTGPVIAKEFSYELSEQGFIAGVEAVSIYIHYATSPTHINYKVKGQQALEALRAEVDWLLQQQYRYNVIGKIAGATKKNTLILIDRRETGDVLLKQLQDKYPHKQIRLVNGSVEVQDRETIKQLIEQSDNTICIAMMQIFRQGIDIANLHYLILAAIGKAKGRFIQSIGRGRRLHPDKSKLILFDIADVVGYSIQHSFDRAAILTMERIPLTSKHFYEPSAKGSS